MKLQLTAIAAVIVVSHTFAEKTEAMFPDYQIKFSPSLVVTKDEQASDLIIQDLNRVKLSLPEFKGHRRIDSVRDSRLLIPFSRYGWDLLSTESDPRLDADLLKVRESAMRGK